MWGYQMARIPPKYKALKFDGDDKYSWAVFYYKYVVGHRSPVFSSMGMRPLVSGCTQREARYFITQRLDKEKQDAEKTVSG
jgi:hypothetical protein